MTADSEKNSSRAPRDYPVSQLEPACEWQAIRASGPGGQNVNKVASAVQLRFDVRAARIPDAIKVRLLHRSDRRMTDDGVLVIKAERHRSQAKNRADALERLQAILREVRVVPRARRATRPTRASQRRRVDAKKQRGQTKSLRRRVDQ